MPGLSAAVRAHRALVERVKEAYPAETEESLADSIDSISELDLTIIAALRHALEREAHAAALDTMISAMVARKRRLEEGAAQIRRAVLCAMQEVGWKKLPAPPPDMSVSITAGKPKVVITDPDALPFDLCRVTTAPDKAAIRKALEEGREVSGALFGNPEPGLAIHRR